MFGILPDSIVASNRRFSGYASWSAFSNNSFGETPSGPDDFVTFRDFRRFSMSSVVIVIFVSVVLYSALKAGVGSSSSWTNTLAKKEFKTFALSESVSVSVPSGFLRFGIVSFGLL